MSETNAFSPAEFKSAAEFDKAHKRLTAFMRTPFDTIADQYQLERSIVGLGDALKTAIQFRGRTEEVVHPSGDKLKTQVIDTKIPGSEDTFEAYADSDAIIISRSTASGRRVYDMDYPLNDDLSNDDAEINSDEFYKATGVLSEEGERDYVPALSPEDPATQQGYASVLKRSIEDMLKVIDPPVKIPEDLAKQFGE